jgi:ParB-like chromosome segregation protein Spo0J
MIEFPVLETKMVKIEKVIANNYNPNKVAKPEMLLLKKSIEDNGFCFPVATIYDDEKDIYVIVDGFHRYTVAKDYLNLKEVPVVVLKHDIKKRIAATIQFNRARGTHQILDMSHIVADLFEKGWNDEQIMEHLGMDLDEVIRLKQVSGLKTAFSNHEFSKTWDEFLEKTNSKQLEIDLWE